MASAALKGSRKVIRKWHPRNFTGCQQCRQRHVKCDETANHCNNCTRLDLVCDGYPQKMDFKIITQEDYSTQRTSPEKAVIDVQGTGVLARSRCPQDQMEFEFSMDEFQSMSPNVVHYTDDPIMNYIVPSRVPEISCTETRYYSHFLCTVSSLLMVYDTHHSSNPYRLSFPLFAQSFWPLAEAMKALGALHLANISACKTEKVAHGQIALKKYVEVVSELRQTLNSSSSKSNLAALATSLLLCMFEMMESRDTSWKVHLGGARDIYENIFRPKIVQNESHMKNGTATETALPMRRFLVSLMSYLDVAGACATGEGTLIEGDYWERFGGGWEYNLGLPSYPQEVTPSDRTMAQIRLSWSRILSIQADISAFAKLKRAGVDKDLHDMIWHDLADRIKSWRSSAPEVYERLSKLSELSEEYTDYDVLAAAAGVEAYEKASIIYLHRVATSTLNSSLPHITTAVERVLLLVEHFSQGIGQLGMLWALFTVGAEVSDPMKQEFVREKLAGMEIFGFKHVSKALEILEYIWLQRRVFGQAKWNDMEVLQSLVLLP